MVVVLSHNISGMPRRRFDSVIAGAGGAGMLNIAVSSVKRECSSVVKVFPTRSTR